LPVLVAAAVRERPPEATARAAAARAALERFQMPSALKTVCALRGVPLGNDVRAPLRALDDAERSELEEVLRGLLEAVPA
jgi:dihydrodipicolinate synthase/N-acetylneuraminate lyase